MKLSIAVIGVLPKQATVLDKRCGSKTVRLKLLGSKQEVPACDQIVIWADFVHHRVQEAAIKLVGRDRVHLFKGGIGGLGDLVESLKGAA